MLLIALIAIVAFLSVKTGRKIMTIKESLERIKKEYGPQIARWVEQIYRLETRNFSSGQYLKTYSAGMEKHSEAFPYGWTTPGKLWKRDKSTAPVGFVNMTDSGNRNVDFLKFRDPYSGMASLAEFLQRYQNPGRWYSTDKGQQDLYNLKLRDVKTLYV